MIRCQLATKKTLFSGLVVSQDNDDSITSLFQLVKMKDHAPKSWLYVGSATIDVQLQCKYTQGPNTIQAFSSSCVTILCAYWTITLCKNQEDSPYKYRVSISVMHLL